MSNLCDSISERNSDASRSTVQQHSTSQPFRSKTSARNKIRDKNACVAYKTSPKFQPKQKQQQVQDNSSTMTFNNSSMNELTTQCQVLALDTDISEPNQEGKLNQSKRNRKKGKVKQLKIPLPNNNANSAQPSDSLGNSEVSHMHNYFANHVSPLYSSTNSKYLENLAYHPHYQYMNGVHQGNNLQSHAASLPNTPIMLQPPQVNSLSIPNSPVTDQNTAKYILNVINHPLLSQSYPMRSFNNFQMMHSNMIQNFVQPPMNSLSDSQEKKDINNKKRRKSKKNEKEGDKVFEAYLSAEDVEVGLKNSTLVEGVLRINPKQYQNAYVSSNDRSEQDVLIEGIKNRNRALEGDIVVVQFLDSEKEEENSDDNKQKKGKIVFIKEKVHTRTCIGTLKLMPDKNRQRALFVPRDHRIPRLNVPFTSWPNNFYQEADSFENTLFLAKIFDWFDTRFALGKIVCNIGQSGDIMTETKAILAQTDLDVTPFGPEVRHLFPRLDYTIPQEEIQIREDCRSLCLFSIDPASCRDIDDAVSCRDLENGNYEIGVHISDVAHFLEENTLLDDKVSEKATTIYLVEKAYHMLPDELCMLCSLFPGVDKLAFSVFWEITPEAKVMSSRFAKTVIHSCCQLAYDHAQAILEDQENAEVKFPETYNGFKYHDIRKSIKILGEIAAIFRKNRFEGGALRIDQPKVNFHLNTTDGLPESYFIYESQESHQLIEEFMLLANMTVANHIYSDHPRLAFLRSHPPPSTYMLKQLEKDLKPMGIELNIESAGDLHRSLLPYVTSEDRGKAMVLSMLCAKPMTRAKYFCADGCEDDDFLHYALNVPLYTHFTSPIRRYADIMVHRLLSASLQYRSVPNWEVDKVRMIAAQCNKQKYNAKKASELSTELYTLKYIEMNSPIETEAVVVDVREKYIDVIIVAMSLNRRIFFNTDFPGEFKCIKHEGGASKLSKMELTWQATENMPKTTQFIEVFSLIRVELNKGDDMIKVETKLVRPN